MFATVSIRRVVLVADAFLEERLLDRIEKMGFLAQSSVECTGRDSRRLAEDVLSRGRVRIEALGTADIARELMKYISDGAFQGHSISCYMDSVEMDERIALG